MPRVDNPVPYQRGTCETQNNPECFGETAPGEPASEREGVIMEELERQSESTPGPDEPKTQLDTQPTKEMDQRQTPWLYVHLPLSWSTDLLATFHGGCHRNSAPCLHSPVSPVLLSLILVRANYPSHIPAHNLSLALLLNAYKTLCTFMVSE